ncbi:glycosyltransferase family 2 protein [Prosthecobacter sp. SYSU 5D2]|uniref:glycosyltransferase family 2 protein n=1 Tax=Prosthecobacter sp. SYSU 5D2 TaxID=3134134 RepID=UPI0031FE51B1
MMAAALPVSVCIPVKDEALNLPACLAGLGDFDEVVVVDSGSTDGTVQIATAAGATVLQFQWDGRLPKKRNWVLKNHVFKHPWVLFLDADERMNEAFANELRSVLPGTSHAGFWISFTNWFMGAPLHHGDVFHKLALFKAGAGEYERFAEDAWSHLDMEVHEHPVLEGTAGEMKSRLEHQDYRGLKNYLARHNEYSSWEANRFLWLHSADASAWLPLNGRQRFKYRYLDRWWLAWLYWGVSVWIKKGFMDGMNGFRFGMLKRRYFGEIRLKIQEARRTGKSA